MTKRIAAAAALAMTLVAGGCGEQARATDWKLTCPPSISTTQSVGGNLPSEWTAFARNSSAMLAAPPGAAVAGNSPAVSISAFDGPPQELAELVPDNPNARRHKWSLAKDRKRDTYMVCNYMDTRMKVAHKVPAAVRSCTVDASKGAGVALTCR